MKPLSHKTAKPSHYNKEAESYDAFNENRSRTLNQLIVKTLNVHKVKTVLDLTCGTGSQVIWLAKQGFDVVGSDINAKMLKIARRKAKELSLDLEFFKGDMCTMRLGEFDAVITIFNAIGHLTRPDFENAIRNIGENLKDGGLYIFDINNLTYLLEGNNITKLTIDWQEVVDGSKVREIQYSTIDNDGVLASYDTYCVHEEGKKPKISKAAQTLQVYTATQLREMLQANGFEVIKQCGTDGSEFIEKTTDRILTIARKARNLRAG